MRRLISIACLAAVLGAGMAQADQRFPATLAGHAILPATSFVPPPESAPPGFARSGRFTGAGNIRVEQVGSIPGTTGPAPNGRATGLALPFEGQPVQGFSGIAPVKGKPG